MPFDIGGTIYSGLEIQKFAKAGIVTNGLVLHLDAAYKNSYPKGGTTWYDLSGNGNNGTMTNGPTYSSDNSGIITFDGSNDYLTIPNTSGNFNIGLGDYTIGVWIFFPSQGNHSYVHLLAFDNQNNFAFKAASYQYGPRDLYFYGSSTYRSFTGDFGTWRLQENKWEYVVLTRNGVTHTAYYNGNLVGSMNVSSNKSLSATNVNIGWDGLTGEWTQQKRGPVHFYNRALSADEIRQNYYATKNRFEWEYTQSIVTNGLVLHLDAGNTSSYPGSGTTWYDLSGNSNHGTLTNGPTFNSGNGGGFVFDGTNDYVTTPSNVVNTNADFTIDFWVKRTSDRDGIVYATYISGVSATGHLQIRDTHVGIQVIKSYIAYLDTFANSLISTLNQPLNIVITLDKSSEHYSLYVDGTFISSVTTAAQTYTTTNTVLGINYSNTEGLTGSMYSFKYYNRILSSTEITKNYNALKGRFGL